MFNERTDNLNSSNPYSALHVRRGLRDFIHGRAMSGILSFAVAFLLVRYMSVQEYAAYITLTGVQMLLMPMTNLGLDRTIARYVPEMRLKCSKRDLFRFSWALLALRSAGFLIFSGAIALFVDELAKFLNIEGYKEVFAVVWIYAFFFALSIHLRCTLQSLMRQRIIKHAYSLEWIPKVIMIAALVVLYGHLTAAEALWIGALTVGMANLYMAYGLIRHYYELPDQPPQVTEGTDMSYKKMARFSIQNYLYLLVLLPATTGSSRMLGAAYLPTVQLAAYGFYQTFSSVIQRYLPLQLMMGLIEPIVMGKYAEHKDFKLLNTMISSLYKFNLFLLLPVIAWLSFAGHDLVTLITGGKYAEYYWLLVVFVISLILGSHTLVIQMIVNAVEKSALLLRSGIISSSLFFVTAGFVFTFPNYALPILAAASLVQPLTTNFYLVSTLRKAGQMYKIDWPGILKIIIIAALTGISVEFITLFLFRNNMFMYVVASGLLNAGVFFSVSALIKPFHSLERETLQKVMGKYRFPW